MGKRPQGEIWVLWPPHRGHVGRVGLDKASCVFSGSTPWFSALQVPLSVIPTWAIPPTSLTVGSVPETQRAKFPASALCHRAHGEAQQNRRAAVGVGVGDAPCAAQQPQRGRPQAFEALTGAAGSGEHHQIRTEASRAQVPWQSFNEVPCH